MSFNNVLSEIKYWNFLNHNAIIFINLGLFKIVFIY